MMSCHFRNYQKFCSYTKAFLMISRVTQCCFQFYQELTSWRMYHQHPLWMCLPKLPPTVRHSRTALAENKEKNIVVYINNIWRLIWVGTLSKESREVKGWQYYLVKLGRLFSSCWSAPIFYKSTKMFHWIKNYSPLQDIHIFNFRSMEYAELHFPACSQYPTWK